MAHHCPVILGDPVVIVIILQRRVPAGKSFTMIDVERCQTLSEDLNELRDEAYLFVYSSPSGMHAHKRCGAQ